MIRDALVIGLNSVTAHLSKPVSKDASPRLQIVFVCYYDVKPQIMCAHLPTLAHVHGSTILVSLRQGAEAQLADCTAMRRVSALCIKVCFSSPHRFIFNVLEYRRRTFQRIGRVGQKRARTGEADVL